MGTLCSAGVTTRPGRQPQQWDIPVHNVASVSQGIGEPGPVVLKTNRRYCKIKMTQWTHFLNKISLLMFETVIDRICQYQYFIEYDVSLQTYLFNFSLIICWNTKWQIILNLQNIFTVAWLNVAIVTRFCNSENK